MPPCVGVRLDAQQAKDAMLTFLQLTDLHLVTPGGTLYGLDPLERLRLAVTDMARRHGPDSACPAAFVVVTGDLTHNGEPEAYRALAAELRRLPFPAHLMVGNHDSRAGLRAAIPSVPVDARGFVQHAFDTPAGRFILLDSLVPGAPHGDFCATRLEWLADRLVESDGPVFLFLHHPPMEVGLPSSDRLMVRSAGELWEVLAPHRERLRHMFFGHLHRPVCGSWHGVPFSSIRGLAHQLWLDFGATDHYPGSHEPPAYAVVRAGPDSVVVHTHDFMDPTATFNL